MTRPFRRRVLYIPGFDPIPPRRYRELYKREGAEQARISGYRLEFGSRRDRKGFGWGVSGNFDGTRTEAEIEVLVWADIVQGSMGQSIPATYGQLVRTAWAYIGSGALMRLMQLRRGPVIAGAIRQFWSETSWGPIDYLLVDMPPGTGDVALTVFQSLPVDGIVIVTSPQDLVSMIVAKAVNMAEKMNVPILGIVENMSYIECPDCGKKIEVFGKSKLPEVAERYNLDILGQLPINPALAEACDKGEVETALPDGMLPKAVSAVEAITPHETDEA